MTRAMRPVNCACNAAATEAEVKEPPDPTAMRGKCAADASEVANGSTEAARLQAYVSLNSESSDSYGLPISLLLIEDRGDNPASNPEILLRFLWGSGGHLREDSFPFETVAGSARRWYAQPSACFSDRMT